MKTVGITLTAIVAIFAVLWAWTNLAVAANKTGRARAAAKLVDEILEREAKEGVEDRAELLKPAREQTPPCEEAYWQSGFIYDAKQKKWLTLDDVQGQADKDDSLAEYRKVREKYKDNEKDQSVLARWCAKHKLDDQARAHWNQVLDYAPDHQEARRQLGFQMVGGKWLTQKEITDNKAQNSSTQAALRRWGPKFQELLVRLASPNEQISDAARSELKAIKDPDVAPAVEAVFFSQNNDEIALVGVEILENVQSPQSAAVLAWHAVFSPWQPVGQAAAAALRRQEKYDYVPLLLEAAEMPIGPQNQLAGSPENPALGNQPELRRVYRIDRRTSTNSWATVEQLKEHPDWRTIPGMRHNTYTPDPVAKNTTNTVKGKGVTRTTQKKEYFTTKDNLVQQRITQNKTTTTWNQLTPVGTVLVQKRPKQVPYSQPDPLAYNSEVAKTHPALRALAESTGATWPKSLSDWWDWWYDYNEVYRPSSKAPKAGEDSESQRGDCMAADTLVSTEAGPVAIEKIDVGDRIYCCDPETGCLALKPILRKTVRPEGKTLKIHAGEEEFEASGGHIFWVAGDGWIKARQLREGMQLHTLHGTLPVESIEPGEQQPTYSLVTEDFHTFFVGKGMMLTHDNTIHPPTDRLVPGLATEKESKSAEKLKKAN